MTRIIKFRAWVGNQMVLNPVLEGGVNEIGELFENLMQYTGLKDKNGTGQEVYEGDIIDEYGNIKGNIYEMDKRETDLVIEGLGTKTWSETEKAGLARGLGYTE